jgi:hypothetical protein
LHPSDETVRIPFVFKNPQGRRLLLNRSIQLEPMMQRWRALARFYDGSESLIILGASITQVRNHYAKAFLDPELFKPTARCVEIVAEQWRGAADRGRWVKQTVLPIPRATVEAA